MKHLKCLDHKHQLVSAKEIKAADLRQHLLDDHRVSIQGVNSRSELGRYHLLLHTIEAFPALRMVST